jgi:murein DD-endopeptidase MepM/ murein hydrolase activator NlpD
MGRMGCRACLLLAVVVLAAVPASAGAAGSPDTAALQVALRGVGAYSGTIDGVAGSGTAAAVRRFQRRHSLPVDGVAGPSTLEALGRRGRPPLGSRTLSRGMRGWDVAALQFSLAWHGFPNGTIDGGYGSHVAAAVRRFQTFAGLPADGVAGPSTIQALRAPIPPSPIRLVAPLRGSIGDFFGPRGNQFHPGIDYPASTGTPVAAAGSGRVISAGWDQGGYGKLVVIQHPLGVVSMYAHLSRIAVNRGDSVVAGARIGRVGATGFATGPHLHFELRLRDAAIDPLTALR